jgi:hypothetical protein
LDLTYRSSLEHSVKYLGIIIGSLLGEQVGGIMSYPWMNRTNQTPRGVRPEFRLWLSYIGCAFSIGGLIMFMTCLNNTGDKWSVKPTIGAGIATAGNQIVTTVVVTYTIDCYPRDTSSIGAFITFVRQTWGFIGFFW